MGRTQRNKRVRGSVRRTSATATRQQGAGTSTPAVAPVVEQLEQATARALDLAKPPIPDLAFHFGLVEHGYELRVFEDGQPSAVMCRDFGDDHPIAELKQSLIATIGLAVKEWRAKL